MFLTATTGGQASYKDTVPWEQNAARIMHQLGMNEDLVL
jgi:hypothetical protein